MADLWFDRELGDLSRRGEMIYSSRPEGVWAVSAYEPVYPDDLELESDEVLGLYGSMAGGIGDMLLGVGVHLPPSLEKWSTVRDVPAAELGSWIPCLVSIDGAFQLAVSRNFDGERVFATTWTGQHLMIFTPSTELTAVLAHRDDLGTPPSERDVYRDWPEEEVRAATRVSPGTSPVGVTSTTPLPVNGHDPDVSRGRRLCS